MFRGCIRSNAVVILSLTQIKNIQFCEGMVKRSFERLHKLKQLLFTAVEAKSGTNLRKENRNFNKLVFNKILYLVTFNCINLPLTAKYTSEKLNAK